MIDNNFLTLITSIDELYLVMGLIIKDWVASGW